MMPSDTRARQDLERATGTTKGRLTAAERWPSPLDLVLHDHFAGDSQPLNPWKTILGTGASVSYMTGITGVSVNSGTTSGQSAQLSWGGAIFIVGSGMMQGFTRDASMHTIARFDYSPSSPTDENTVALCGLVTTTTGFTADGAVIGFDGQISTSYMVAVTRKNGIPQVTKFDGSGGGLVWQPSGLQDQTWRLVDIYCDQESAAIRFFVDGEEVATHDQDIPSGATDYLMPWFGAMNRGASGVNRKIEVDAVMVREGWAE